MENTVNAMSSTKYYLIFSKRCHTKPLNILIWAITEKERTGNEKGI